MGLWDFVKSAGKALGIGDAEAAEAPAPEALKKEVEDLGLKTEGLDVEVEGDTVKVSGKAASQAEKEKMILAVGNVAGVAKVEEALETPEPAAEPVFHTVVKGDTLWKIAEKTLGKGARYQEIFEANRPMLSDPGQDLPGPGAAHPGEVPARRRLRACRPAGIAGARAAGRPAGRGRTHDQDRDARGQAGRRGGDAGGEARWRARSLYEQLAATAARFPGPAGDHLPAAVRAARQGR